MDLKEEILAGESYVLEFKRVPNEERDKYLKTVVAFANGKGGRILFGVANDMTIVGIPNETIFREMDGIVNSISESCVPKIPVDVCIEHIEGKSVIALDVFAGTRCPYYLKKEGEKGGVYVRIGATTRQADDATRHELALESEGRSFDREPCPKARINDKSLQALCARMYRIARENCQTDAERRKVKRVTVSQLEAWGIILQERGKWVATNAYALLTGDPALSLRVKCGVFKGDTKAVFVDRRENKGSMMELIEIAHDYILAKINMGCRFKGVFRQDHYELPPDEMRELVINAFVHRNYIDTDAPIFVAVYDTRVEIVSPGGLPRGLTVDKALAGCSKIRNKALAEALTYMRYVEGWGSGLLRVNQKLEEYGLPAIGLADDGISTRMNVYRYNCEQKKAGNGHEKAGNGHENAGNGHENAGNGHENARNGHENAGNGHENAGNGHENAGNGHENQRLETLTNKEKQIFAAVKSGHGRTIAQISRSTGISERTVRRKLEALVLKNFIKREGSDTKGDWVPQ